MSAQRTTCVVAGGGPAGMFLGLLLARAGIEVTVLEKHADFLRDFRGDTVHASTLRLIDELGLRPKFDKLPYSRMDHLTFPAPDGAEMVIGDFRTLPGEYQYIAMVPQWDLLDLLAESANAEPSFTLRMNTEVTGAITENGRVVGVRYLTASGEDGELRADLTVAADGRWSVLRRAAKLEPREYSVPFDTWWFRLPRHDEDGYDQPNFRAGQHEMALAIPRTGYYQIAYFATKGSDAALRAEGLQRFRERIVGMFGEFADRIDTLTDLDELKVLDVRLNRLSRWYVPGLLCIGDAAHAMSPAGGVGINLAIQDAVTAARLLAEPLRRQHVPTAELARVQAKRWLPTVTIQALQRTMHRAVFGPLLRGELRGTPTAWSVANRFPLLRRAMAYLIAIGLRSEHAPAFARRDAD